MEEQEELALKLDSDYYFITWNPKPKFYNYDKYGNNDYNNQWHLMMKKLIRIKHISKHYVIVPEVSENGKLHCHGWFQCNDIVKYHKSFRPSLRRIGSLKTPKISTIASNSFEYYKKDLHITKQFLGKFDIIAFTPSTYAYYERTISELDKELILNKIDNDNDLLHMKRMDIYQVLLRNGCIEEYKGDSDDEDSS